MPSYYHHSHSRQHNNTCQPSTNGKPATRSTRSITDHIKSSIMAQIDENNHGGIGLFGDDEEQEQNYNDAADLNDILGLDDEEDADAMLQQTADPEGSLLMRFCPHDSSMLYPKVRREYGDAFFITVVVLSTHHMCAFLSFISYHIGNSFIPNYICKLNVASILYTINSPTPQHNIGKPIRAQTPLRMPPMPLHRTRRRSTNLQKCSQKRSGKCPTHRPLGGIR